MPAVSLLVPFRARPQDERKPPPAKDGAHRSVLWDWCARRWRCEFPTVEIVTGSSDDVELNRSRARNAAFDLATGDVLIVADADVAAPAHQVRRAIDLVTRGAAQWVIGYFDYHMLSGPDTLDLLAEEPCSPLVVPDRPRWSTDQGNAGLTVMTRAAWERVGGYDERFEMWGWEDWAFANALETLVHPQVRVDGFVLSLRHPRPKDRTKRQGKALWKRYEAAHGDPDAMDDLVHEAGRR